MKLGIDIGSITAKAVVLDEADNIIESRYTRTRGQPVETILTILEDLLASYSPSQFKIAATTGTGGELIAKLMGVPFVNEIIAQATGTARFHPEVKTILEIGGEDSKLIILGEESPGTSPKVTDFAINGVCAAGTGSFLDQQASRMGIPIEDFGNIALKSEHPPRVAGRCSVFAKSDMIQLQQVGTPVHDIVAGLCFAMIRNFKGQVIRGRDLGSFIASAKEKLVPLEKELPSGYRLTWGGQFENQERATRRLAVVVPVALLLILLMQLSALGNIRSALLVILNLPFSLVGGIWTIWLMDMNISVSVLVGLIVLLGMAVQHGTILVSFIDELRRRGMGIAEAVEEASIRRLRPLLMTKLTSLLGLVPMVLSAGPGSDIQRPLAAVVLGGLLFTTLLNMYVVPALYGWFHRE